MGQKVNPHGIRVGVIKDWSSKWYAGKDFADFLVEDYKIREFLKKKLYDAGVGSIDIERTSDRVIIIVSTSQPGIVIGKGGADVDRLKVEVQKLSKQKVDLKVKEIKKADLNAQLVAEKIAKDLEARISFRRAMKSAMGRTMKNGAKGIKTSVSGRLGGADMAPAAGFIAGSISLSTPSPDIEYGFAEADTTYGKVGVKCWIYLGEVLPTKGNNKKEGSDK